MGNYEFTPLTEAELVDDDGDDLVNFEDYELYDGEDDLFSDNVADPEPHSADDPWWIGMRSDW